MLPGKFHNAAYNCFQSSCLISPDSGDKENLYMYWFRDGTALSLVPWVAISIIWLLGGWLLATHAFHLERRERLIVGFGLGLVPYLWFVNLLGHWVPSLTAFVLAGILVLLIGIAFAWRGERPILRWKDFEVWHLLIAGIILVWIFTRIGIGISWFDDRKNLAIISTMAAGDIPPHFYMNSAFYFAYHYGFQLFGASLVRLGGLFPWSAFDLSKAIVGAYSVLLAYLLGRRYIKNVWGGLVMAVVFTFATGTRYLLLLLPVSILDKIDKVVKIKLVEQDFTSALLAGLDSSTGPPFPFNIAYLNSIKSWPRFIALQAGPGTLAIVILILIWLLASRSKRSYSFLILIILFSMWGLSWEATYGLFLLGGIVVTIINWIGSRKISTISPVSLAMFLSVPVVLIQGGTITELLRKEIWGSVVEIAEAPALSQGVLGFSLRWPPAIPTTHLSTLHLSSPYKVLVGLFELGPVVLFAPLIIVWAWRLYRKGDWTIGALNVSSLIGFSIPIFLSYRIDRDITRLMAYSIDVWTFLLVLFVYNYAGKWAKQLRQLGIVALGLMIFGGVVIAGTTLTAAAHPTITYGFTELDSNIASDLWDQLPPGSEIFDPAQWRVTVLTGRLTHSAISSNVPLPEWEGLRANPTLDDLLAKGYRYIYIDESWWLEIPPDSRQSLSSSCVAVLAEYQTESGEFRRLVDITGCQR
jgi:hypothetical protein